MKLFLLPALIAGFSIQASVDVTELLDAGSRSTMMVQFQQSASSGTDATTISKITLAYFTSSDCTGSKAGSGFYTTADGTSFTISVGTAFGMVAASAWNVGSSKLSVADMTTVQSIGVTFKSTNNTTPQAQFSSNSFACVAVTCASGECTSASGTQSFTLKTTAAVGDYADGGIIACLNTSSGANLYNLIATKSDSSSAVWGGSGTATGATSTSNGASNTTTIVTGALAGTYAAKNCNSLSATGGFTSGWFLPAGNSNSSQSRCLYGNKASLGGTMTGYYWTSTENSSTTAYGTSFSNGSSTSGSKGTSNKVRCVREF